MARRIVGITIVGLSAFALMLLAMPVESLRSKAEFLLLPLGWPILLGLSLAHGGPLRLTSAAENWTALLGVVFVGLEIAAWVFRMRWLALSLLVYALTSVVAAVVLVMGAVPP